MRSNLQTNNNNQGGGIADYSKGMFFIEVLPEEINDVVLGSVKNADPSESLDLNQAISEVERFSLSLLPHIKSENILIIFSENVRDLQMELLSHPFNNWIKYQEENTDSSAIILCKIKEIKVLQKYLCPIRHIACIYRIGPKIIKITWSQFQDFCKWYKVFKAVIQSLEESESSSVAQWKSTEEVQ